MRKRGRDEEVEERTTGSSESEREGEVFLGFFEVFWVKGKRGRELD